MSRRGNGEGSIYKRADGRWCAVITHGRDENGKFIRYYYYGKSRLEVSQKILESQGKIQNQTFVAPDKKTLGQWLDDWLRLYKHNNVSNKTFESYEYLTRLHIKPILGDVKLQELTKNMIVDIVKKKKQILADSTVRKILIVIKSSLEEAKEQQYIIKNVAENIKFSRQESKVMPSLTLDESISLINASKKERLGLIFRLLIMTGMRVGEALALKWSDMNFATQECRIDETRVDAKVFKYEENNKLVGKRIVQEGDTKTVSSDRTIPIPDILINELKLLHSRQEIEKKRTDVENKNPDGFLFTIMDGGILKYRYLNKIFKRIIKKAEIRNVNIHILRHTFATRCMEERENVKTVSEILGHKDVSVTLQFYTHPDGKVKKEAVNKVSRLYGKSIEKEMDL